MSDMTSQLPYYLVLNKSQVKTLQVALEEAIASFDSRANDYLDVDNDDMALHMEETAADVSELLDHIVATTNDSIYPARNTEVLVS